MTNDTAKAPEQQAVKDENRISAAASENAPFIAFDGAPYMGFINGEGTGTGTIALAAGRFVGCRFDPAGRAIGVEADSVITAHLRGDLTAFRRLRDAINELERIHQAKTAIAAREGDAVATMQ